MANSAPPPAPPGAAPSAPPPRHHWFGVTAALVLIAALVAAFGEDVVSTAAAVARRFTGGGRLYWSDGEAAWEEIPLALLVRRDWGPTDRVIHPRWAPVAPGLELADLHILRPPNPRDVELVLARVSPEKWRFRVWGRADWSRAKVSTLADEAGMVLAVNGPYFAEDGPLGLVVSDGVIRNRQGTLRAAHFLVDHGQARPRIVNEKKADVRGVDQGFQGFPAIMTAGHTFGYLRTGGRGFDVREVDRRTAACITGDGQVILLATDTWTSGLSFSELATVLGGLGCYDAMAFDGGASTALWVDVGDTQRDVDGLDTVPVILGVSAR